MTTVNSTLEALGLNTTQQDTKKSSDSVGQEDFLKLMVTQLANQDPFKPMENGEFLTQIAQFSQASGINELQKSFSTLADSMTSNQVLQASTLVGRTVLIPSNVISLDSNGAQAGVELPSSTSSLVVTIADGAGQVIRQVDLGQQAAGRINFVWDGTDNKGNQMPLGRYQVKAEMRTADGNVALDTLVTEKVESVTMNTSGMGLTVNLSGIGSVELSKVKEIM